MEIDIKDYLSDTEMKDIVTEEVKLRVRNLVGENPNGLIKKVVKDVVLEQMQELIPNFEELLNNHIKEQIATIKIETLFWESMGWRSNGNKLINKILAANEPLIEAKVKEIFK